MLSLTGPYKKRPIRFQEIWNAEGWRIKTYGISCRDEFPRVELVEAAKTAVIPYLKQPGGGIQYGVGFLGIHDGRNVNFVFLDLWSDEYELYHHTFVSPTHQPEKMEYITPSGMIATVWDLRVIGFEREAWLENVLANPSGPDLEAYLSCQLNEDA